MLVVPAKWVPLFTIDAWRSPQAAENEGKIALPTKPEIVIRNQEAIKTWKINVEPEE